MIPFTRETDWTPDPDCVDQNGHLPEWLGTFVAGLAEPVPGRRLVRRVRVLIECELTDSRLCALARRAATKAARMYAPHKERVPNTRLVEQTPERFAQLISLVGDDMKAAEDACAQLLYGMAFEISMIEAYARNDIEMIKARELGKFELTDSERERIMGPIWRRPAVAAEVPVQPA